MAATDARPIPRKNTAYRVTFPILDADGDLVSGATGLDSEVSIDGGTFTDCANEAVEIASASGMYYLDLTASEMNGDTIAVIIKSSTGKTTPIVLYPEEAGDIRVNVTQISDDSTAADNLEAAADEQGYNLGGGAIVAASVTGNVGGNVTGNVGGNVSGSVGSIATGGIVAASFAAGAITAAAIAADAIDADALAADAIAEINATVDAALADIRLDELLAADSDIDGATPPTVGSVFFELLTKTAGSFTYDQATDSLEAIRDRGDAAWLTAAGFSTHTAADVWAVATRTLTSAANITSTGGTTVPQTGDSFARLGAPAGTSVSADIAAIKSDSTAILDDTGTSGVIVASLAANSVTAASIAADAANEIADAILGRSVSNVEATAGEHTLCTVVLAMLESSMSGSTWTIKRTDGSTTHATKTVATDAAADPITGVS